MPVPPLVIVLSGLDPTGGAGLLADIRALAAAGVRISPLITANTLQGPNRNARFEPVNSSILAEQLELIYHSFKPAAVKIGMLGSVENALVIDEFLKKTRLPSVLDPVMQASSGGALVSDGIIEMIQKTAPQITLITPNKDELSRLSGLNITTGKDIFPAAEILTRMGFQALLVKGGHFEGDPRDYFFLRGELKHSFKGKRHAYTVRGTGCHLASSIAGMLALGQSLDEAVKNGYFYVQKMITDYKNAGNGILPADMQI